MSSTKGRSKFDEIIEKIIKEMMAADVVGGSPSSGEGIAPQDNVDYAKGDARLPKVLGATKKRKKTPIMKRKFPKGL